MKKIIPLNNVLEFSTDVAKIMAISLEHEIKKDEDCIQGEFFISGEYKITDGQLENDKFSFELPFDIALGCDYKLDTMVVDIDDFRYELVGHNKLKVNIDLYVDGEEEVLPVEVEEDNRKEDNSDMIEETDNKEELILDRPDDKVENEISDSEKQEDSIFSGFNEQEVYVTYRVYRVCEGDTIDKIMEKYNISKEELANYNSIDNIKAGDKLIIPTNDKQDNN